MFPCEFSNEEADGVQPGPGVAEHQVVGAGARLQGRLGGEGRRRRRGKEVVVMGLKVAIMRMKEVMVKRNMELVKGKVIEEKMEVLMIEEVVMMVMGMEDEVMGMEEAVTGSRQGRWSRAHPTISSFSAVLEVQVE